MRLTLEEFDIPDTEHPRYSLPEVDFYGHIRSEDLAKGEGQHRLSLRKDLSTGKFQVYAHYLRTIRRKEYEEIIFESADLREAFTFGGLQAKNKWGDKDWNLEIVPAQTEKCAISKIGVKQ